MCGLPLCNLHWYEKVIFLAVQVFRVLKSDAVFVYVTYRQPHFIRPLLSREGAEWDIKVDVLGGPESSLDYHGFVLKKAALSTAESANVETEKRASS